MVIIFNFIEEILSDLEIFVNSFDMKEEYVRKKMDEWLGFFEIFGGLLINVISVNEIVYNVIVWGEEILKKVKDLLERFKVGN